MSIMTRTGKRWNNRPTRTRWRCRLCGYQTPPWQGEDEKPVKLIKRHIQAHRDLHG